MNLTDLDKRWAKPKPVSQLDMAFGAAGGNLDDYLPPMAEIPKVDGKWVDFQQTWFFKGLKDANLIPKEGIDLGLAIRHLKTIQGSYEPKHEHKMAGVAYLASLWFDPSSTW